MSVIVSNRSESTLQFVATGREILKYTIQKCLLLPKRITFVITIKITDVVQEFYRNIIHIKNMYEDKYLEERINKCEECISDLEYIASQLDIIKIFAGENIPEYNKDLKKKNHINSKQFETWLKLIETEIALLRGLIKKDKERLKETN